VRGKSSFELGKWHHVVGTFERTLAKLYVDGELHGSREVAPGELVLAESGQLQIGASWDAGRLLRTEALVHEVAIYSQVLRADEIAGRYAAKRDILPQPPRETYGPFTSVLGPFAEFLSEDTLEVTWDTENPAATWLEFGTDLQQSAMRVDSPGMATQHRVTVHDVRRETVYQLRVRGATSDDRPILTETYEVDSHFAYLPTPKPDRPCPYADDERTGAYEDLAKRMIDAAGTSRGYALVLGSSEGRLAYHLARQSDLQVVIVDPDANHVRRAREALDAAGLYGNRVSVHLGDFDALPYGRYFANLVTSDLALDGGGVPGGFRAAYDAVRPAGGVLYVGGWGTEETRQRTRTSIEAWLGTAPLETGGQFVAHVDGLFWVHRRGKLLGAGEWTHQYAQPDNSACSKDKLVQGELAVQWWGRPGARPMPDRGNRNPAPVSAAGRLYVQGNRVLFGMDAYNGTILWTKQIPTMRRANVPRDGSNMVATDDRLYLAIGGHCVGLDGQTGRRELNFSVPKVPADQPYDWGYLACVDPLLVGSGVKRGAHYLGDNGEWYEGFGNEHIARVTSDYLFAVDRHTGGQQWRYQKGVIINSTITLDADHVYFVESRNPAALASRSGRIQEEVLHDQHLVALRLEDGRILWEKPCDFSKCQYMTYMVYGNQTILVTGTDEKRDFHTYAFDVGSGTEIWQHHTTDKKGHHTGQLAHPTVVGDEVYFNKHTYALRTGKVLHVDDFNWHGCGAMSASQHLIFQRYEFHGTYDVKTKKRTELLGVRSGCWIGLIPSGGMLLAPESGAGCSCGHSLQTSVAYAPK
jgi:outer membrane protein assembly factor BamB